MSLRFTLFYSVDSLRGSSDKIGTIQFCLLFGVLGFLFLLFVLFSGLVFGIVTTTLDCVAGPYASITVGFTDAP